MYYPACGKLVAMTITRRHSPSDFPLALYAVCGFERGADEKPVKVWHVRAGGEELAVAETKRHPSADGLVLRATKIKASAPAPAGVVYEGPWPW